MPVTLPLEVYEALEKGLGKEDARKVVRGLEETISSATEYKWATTRDEIITEFRKEIGGVRTEIDSLRNEFRSEIGEIRGEIRREFVTKELFEERMNSLRLDLEGKVENVRLEMHSIKADLEGKVENVRLEMHGIKADLEGKIENVRVDLEGKIERVRVDLNARIDRVDTKLNFLIILVIIALTLMNPVAAEIIKSLLKL